MLKHVKNVQVCFVSGSRVNLPELWQLQRHLLAIGAELTGVMRASQISASRRRLHGVVIIGAAMFLISFANKFRLFFFF